MIKSLAALALVIGLMMGLTWILKRLRIGGTPVADAAGRLRVTASAPLDLKHKAVILQVDGVEHTVILGGEQPLLVGKTLAVHDVEKNAG